jgi:transcription-repair coupling factor (superfamily II helicase)
LTPSTSGLTNDSRKRLQTLEEFSELGDGFKVAMRDLDIRGAGNLLGAEQSGFVNDLGYELYHKMLDEAVQELKENEFKDLFASTLTVPQDLLPDCQIETDYATLIPETYVKNISERLSLYTRLDNLKGEDELKAFEAELLDRFGPLPLEVQNLLRTVRLRLEAEILHFEKLTLKSNTMKGYFVSSQNDKFFQSPKFGKVIDYIQKHPKRTALKDSKGKLILICQEVTSLSEAQSILEELSR